MAVGDGKSCGLALDDCNEPEKTAGRIADWVAGLKVGQEHFLP